MRSDSFCSSLGERRVALPFVGCRRRVGVSLGRACSCALVATVLLESGHAVASTRLSKPLGWTTIVGLPPRTRQQVAAPTSRNVDLGTRRSASSRFMVRGKVGIDEDFTDTVIVKLQTPNHFMDVMAYDVAPEVAGSLREGQALTLTCCGEGRVMGSPVLRRCR